jgi:HEAT repeat protein
MRQPPPGDDLRSDRDVPGDIRYDPDLAVHEPMQPPEAPIEPSRRRSPLLLLALTLPALAIAVYVLFGLIANEGKSSDDYLNEIRMRRGAAWQAAFELSRLLPFEDPSRRDPRFVPRLLSVFESAREDDPRLRRYLALALRELRDPRATDPLLAALGDTDLLTRLYAAWALGEIGDPRAAEGLIPLLEDEEADLRKVGAFALGALRDWGAAGVRAAPALRGALHDPVEDVAWNAALALARRGDHAGLPLLRRMLDRGYLAGVQRPDENGISRRLTETQKDEAILNALVSLARLRDRASLETVRSLREADPSLKVRQAAAETLAALERAPAR